MKKLLRLKGGGEKCPHCGTVFAPESLHPFDVQARKEARRRRRARRKRKI